MNVRLPVSRLTSVLRAHGFVLALGATMLYLLVRNLGLMPMVFADEWYYSSGARLLEPAQSILPSHLYFALYRWTSSCGTGFLDCGRLFNTVFYIAAAPFLFLLARRVCSRAVASTLVVLSLLGALNIYTAYFMPEAMYFFAFCVFAWVALRLRALPPFGYGLLTGTLLGVMASIKVHGLFLMPGLLAFMAYLCWQLPAPARRWRTALLMMPVAVVAMLVVKAGIGYLLAGRVGLSLLGTFYSGGNGPDPGGIAALVPAALISLRAHTFAMALMFVVPLAMVLLHASDARLRAAQNSELRALQVFALLMLGATVGVSVLFTAKLGVRDARELLRIHQRYYDFVFPLLTIVAAAAMANAPNTRVAPLKRALVALFAGGLMVVAAVSFAPSYVVSQIDSPTLLGFLWDKQMAWWLVGGSLAVLAVWTWQRRYAAPLFVFVLLPCVFWQGEAGVRTVLANARASGPIDKAALIVKNYLKPDELAQLTVAGDTAEAMRAMFIIDHPKVVRKDLAPGVPLATDDFTPRQKWVLVLGNHAVPPTVTPVLKSDAFALMQVNAKQHTVARVDFGAALPSALVDRIDGLSGAEPPMGRWSDAARVTLHFAAPLPKALTLLLTAKAFGPNVGADVVLTVGAQKRVLHLTPLLEDRYVTIDTDGTEQTITFDVPKPVSPTALGVGADTRLLGIGLNALEIGSRD